MANWKGLWIDIKGFAPRDAELRYTKNGDRRVLSFSLGVDVVDPQGADKRYVRVVVLEAAGLDMDDLAEAIRTGTTWHVSGVTKVETWTDKETGEYRANLSVYAMKVRPVSAAGPDSHIPPAFITDDDDDVTTSEIAGVTGHTPLTKEIPF